MLYDYAALTGDTLAVNVNSGHEKRQSTANARTGDLFGGSNVDAQMKVYDHANLTFGDQVTSTTANGKTADAVLSFGSVSATSGSCAIWGVATAAN